MSDAIPYKQIIDRVKSDIDWIAEQAHAKGYNEAKLIYQNPNAESDYQRGLNDGKARNEDGCVGCRYDDGTTEHSPCNYCCNAYSNQWSAKPCSDEIKVGDEVDYKGMTKYVVTGIDDDDTICGFSLNGLWNANTIKEVTKTGRHFPQVEELLKAMKEGSE